MPSETNTPDIEPVNLWKKSNIVAEITSRSQNERAKLSEIIGSGNASNPWINIYKMTTKEKNNFVKNIQDKWPYRTERLIHKYGLQALPAISFFNSIHINGTICANMFLYQGHSPGYRKTNYTFRQGITRSPKIAAIFPSIGTLVISLFGMQAVLEELWAKEELCQGCFMAKVVGSQLFSGLFIPVLLSTIMANMEYNKIYNYGTHRTFLESLKNYWEGAKPIWPRFMHYFLFNSITAIAIGAALIQTREKMCATLYITPEIIRQMYETPYANTFWNRIKEKLDSLTEEKKNEDWDVGGKSFEKEIMKSTDEIIKIIEKKYKE